MKISVIICTYDRYKNLSEALDDIQEQKIDENFDYEVIVVGNNSKEITREVVESFSVKNNRIKYVFESTQGKTNAMNVGVNNSKGEILAFTDDDVVLDNNWLSNIAAFSLEYDFDAFGGKVVPLYPPEIPYWFKNCKEILNGPVVSHDYGDRIKLYDKTMLPFLGANMIIKRKVFDEIGGFNINLGPGKGTWGEDTDYFRKLQRNNKIIFYNPNVLIFHAVIKERMSLEYFAKWSMAQGRYMVIKDIGREEKNLVYIFGVPRYLFCEVITFFWMMIKSVNNKCQFIKSLCGLFIRVGMIFAYRERIS